MACKIKMIKRYENSWLDDVDELERQSKKKFRRDRNKAKEEKFKIDIDYKGPVPSAGRGGSVLVSVKMLPLLDIRELVRESKVHEIQKLKKCEIRLDKIKLYSRECDIKISKIDLKRHLKKSRVILKRMKLPNGFGSNIKIGSDNNKSSLNDVVGVNRLKLNPKTLKERKANDEILRHFSQDHEDDMFSPKEVPNYVSKFNLLDSSFSSNSSDEEALSDYQPHTPLTKHLENFGGWSAQTPDHVREDEVGKQTEGDFSDVLAFVHRTLDERKKLQKSPGKRIVYSFGSVKESVLDLDSVFSSDKSSTPKKSRGRILNDFLDDLEPVLKNQNQEEQDMSTDEIEPYFEF